MAWRVLRARKEGMRADKIVSTDTFLEAHLHEYGFNFTISDSEVFENQLVDSKLIYEPTKIH